MKKMTLSLMSVAFAAALFAGADVCPGRTGAAACVSPLKMREGAFDFGLGAPVRLEFKALACDAHGKKTPAAACTRKPFMIMRAWADWMWSGKTDAFAGQWDRLVNDYQSAGSDVFAFKATNALESALYYRNLGQLSQMAAALGKKDLSARLASEADRFAPAFRKAFFRSSDWLYADTPGGRQPSAKACAAALAFGLAEDNWRKTDKLVEYIREASFDRGGCTARLFLEAFAAAGRADIAVKLMAVDGGRSWKGAVGAHATAKSGACGAWGALRLDVIARTVLGVTPLKPGFAEISVNPQPGILRDVDAEVPVPGGSVSIRIDGGELELSVPVPARVVWAGKTYEVKAGKHVFGRASATGDAAEIMKKVRAASAAGGGTVKLERKVYEFRSQDAQVLDIPVSNHDHHRMQPVALPFTGITNVTLDASGSVFRMYGEAVAFAAVDSLGVSLRNVSIEWARPYFAELEVTAFERGGTRVKFNPDRFDCRVDDRGELMLHGEDWTAKLERAHFVDRSEGGACIRKGSDWYLRKPKTALGGNEILLGEDLSEPIHGRTGVGLEVGDVVVIRAAVRPRPAMFLFRAKDTSFDGVHVSGGFGMGLIAQCSENVTFLNGSVAPSRKDEFSAHTVDATHFSSVKGLVRVENSLFKGMLDDAINIHATSLIIREIVGDRVIRCRDCRMDGKGYGLLNPGDNIRFINGDSLENGSLRKVTAVENLTEDEMILHLDGDVPEGYRPGDAIENIDWFADIVFRGNRVCDNRARAVLFTTTGSVLCESNVFERVSGAGIRISGDAVFWYETGAASRVTVRGNVFDGCQRRHNGGAVIIVDPMVKKLEQQRRAYHRELVVEDNVFRNVRDGAYLSAYSLEKLVWKGNDDGGAEVSNPSPRTWNVTGKR